MSVEKKPRLAVEDNIVVTLSYTLTVDNQILETSDEGDDLQFIQGAGMVLPALEKQLYGMQVGDAKQLTIKPADGYGEIDPEKIRKFSRDEFPAELPLKKGVELEMKADNDDVIYARVDAAGQKQVTLNFNHPLAGKQLDFSVRVVALRMASPEELDHGHIHTPAIHE